MSNKIVLKSIQDNSINYIHEPEGVDGYFESRFVQRTPDYFIVYLSSHSGCNQACRFCHLTQTKQTMMTPASLSDYLIQANSVLNNIDFDELEKQGLSKVKFSFMARGEPLLNPTILNEWNVLRKELKKLVPNSFDVEFCISTIFPKEFLSFKKPLAAIFTTPDVTMYWSIYSVGDAFRKRWLRKALDIHTIKAMIEEYVRTTGNKVKYHSAFIKGQNDTTGEVLALKDFLTTINQPYYRFNVVSYNPYSREKSEESPHVYQIAKVLKAKAIKRIGYDVKASCGMFYNKG